MELSHIPIQGDGSHHVFHGRVALARLIGYQAEQMKGAGMIRTLGRKLLRIKPAEDTSVATVDPEGRSLHQSLGIFPLAYLA